MNTQLNPTTESSQTTFKKYFKRFLVVCIGGVVILGAVITFYLVSIFGGLHSDLSTCAKGRTQLFSRTQSLTSEFNAMQFIPGQESVTADVTQQQGDCLDSLPTIYATKEYTTTTTAGAVFDEITAVLSDNGYTAQSNPTKVLNPCSSQYQQYAYTKADQEIDVQLTCASYDATGDSWRQVPVTDAKVLLGVSWAYPQN